MGSNELKEYLELPLSKWLSQKFDWGDGRSLLWKHQNLQEIKQHSIY